MEADAALLTLQTHAARFRRAMEETNFDRKATPNLTRFPKDCCHHAAHLFAMYLFDKGLGLPSIVCGQRGDTEQHCWLELDGVIVDLTGDQFGEDQPPVFVGRDSEWHKQWRRLSSGCVYDEAYFDNLRQLAYTQAAYPKIIATLNADSSSV